MLNAYAIVFAALLVPAGRAADLIGRRAAFLTGMIVFAVASAACAAAPDVWVWWALGSSRRPAAPC